ncbi:MAG: DNA mismatch repair protein MutS [Lachnospiraceae bacterium]|nr:DNA mismatch repair protein MutS [Lachnospiraceae bacterium]
MQVRGGTVCDNASKLLRSLRGDIMRAEQAMREKAEAVIRSNKDSMSDSFATQRGGHICVPVKKEYKFRISGSVIDKSATGNTIFIEPATVAKYYEELVMLRLGEEDEVRRILYGLTSKVAEIADIMAENIRVMEKLDYIFSKGKLSQEYDGVEPEMNLSGRIVIMDGRHPLMDRKVCVPLQFRIGCMQEVEGAEKGMDVAEEEAGVQVEPIGDAAKESVAEKEMDASKKDSPAERGMNVSAKREQEGGSKREEIIRGIVITGPNTGGKTVAIKTVALACLMAQCGLHVTCARADLCMRSNYLCDIGDGQSLSENLSTFSAHIVNVLDILKNISPDSLVILDELGSGTDPAEGMGLAVAILDELKKSGALFVVTTHYPEVKQYAAKEPGICNARMTFDRESLKPTYQLVIGEAGESCAFYIAARYGMPERMLERAARAAYGEYGSHANFGKGGSGNQRDKFPDTTPEFGKTSIPKLKKQRQFAVPKLLADKFHLGDSVMLYPDKKLAIVCEPVNEKGVLRVQLPDKKIWINHKRVKLVVEAKELYPPDYDFSIIFDTPENRKLRHDMQRKYVDSTKDVSMW